MNFGAINRTIAMIEKAESEQCSMGYYFHTRHAGISVAILERGEVSCKTAACVAGWAIVANKPLAASMIDDNAHKAIDHLAGDVLGLTRVEQCDDLFHLKGLICSPGRDELYSIAEALDISPRNTSRAISVFDSLPADIRKRSLINVLTHLRDTSEVDWLSAINKAVNDATGANVMTPLNKRAPAAD